MWHNDYVGIPFVANGRERTGSDCWGLVRLIYTEQFNIELPSFSTDYEHDDTARIAELTAQYKEAWEETSEPKYGSVVLFRVKNQISHIGIYIGDNNFLHCCEKYGTIIESLDSVSWNKRIAGFFNYSEKCSAVLNVVPHPLRTERWTVPVPPGTTVDQLSTWVLEKFGVSSELASQVTIIKNGVVVPKEAYLTTIISDKDHIEYRAVPGKSLFRIFLVIVVAYVAFQFGGPLGAALLGPGAAPAAAAAVGSVIISTLGNLLIGYLMPIRPPSSNQNDPGTSQSQLLLAGGSNQVSKYAAIPVVLGRVRMTPLLGGENYIDSNTDNSYLNMLLVWGFGPLDIDKTTLRIGMNGFNQYENGAGIPIQHYHLNDAVTDDDNSDKANFNALYGSDRQQVYSGITLAMHTTPDNVNFDEGDGYGAVGPWTTVTLDQVNTSKIDVNIHFPQGLRQLRVKGKHAGDIYDLEIKLQVQIRTVNSTGTVFGAWGSATNATIPATTVIANQAYDSGSPKYQWTRIGIGVSGLQVKVGPMCNGPYDASGLGGYYNFAGKLASVSNNAGPRLPSWPGDVYALADVCMYGNTLYTIDQSVRSGAIAGCGITSGEISSVNYNTANWANPAAGADTGDKLISIAAGTCARSTNTVISLGTQASGLFRQRKDAFSYTITTAVAALPNEGYYQVRVRRLTDDNVDTTDLNNKNMYVAVFQTATATASNKPINEASSNWRLCKSAVRIKANDQLNSRIEGINAIVTTICKDWNAATSTWVMRKTNNPASLFLYILEHPANAYRITAANLTSKVNFTALQAWHVFCASNGFTFNSVVSTQRSVLEILKDICAAGRASPAMVDGKWTVVVDEAKSNIVQHFTPHNSWGFESVKRLPKRPHALRVGYLDSSADYQEDEAIIYNTGYAAVASGGNKAAEIFEQISLPGITDYTTIAKHARWHLAQASLRPEIYTINTDLEYLVCNRGDRVKVVHDVPLWGLGSGRIKNRIVTSTPTSISSTLISVGSYDVTATVTNQVYPIYNVGDTITVSGSPILGYNGTKTVTACTPTTVKWTDTVTGTATISNTLALTTTAITVNTGTGIATATFANQGYVPFAVGSRIYITGAVPTSYNGTRLVTECTATTVKWADSVTTITATTQGTVTGTIVPSIVGTECSVFELDEELALETTASYTVRIRSKTGGSYLWTIAAVSVNGYYDTIKISRLASDGVSTPITDKIDVNDLFLFGKINSEAQDLLVLAIEPFGNQNAKITLVDYAETLFTTNYATENFTVPNYSSKITLPTKNLVQSIFFKPIITSIISDETVMEQISTGNYKINMKVGFTNPPNLPTEINYVVAEIDYSGDNVDNWHTTVPVLANKQSITVTGIDELKTYRIRLRYQSEDGRLGPWQEAMTSPVSSAAWGSGSTSGVLNINTVSRHSFSTGSEVYLYNAQGTSLNNIYTVDTVPSTTSLTCAVIKPITGITSAVDSTVASTRVGYATAEYTGSINYPVGSQILVSGASPTTYNGTAYVTSCDGSTVSWAAGNLLTYTEDLRDTAEAGGTRPWSQTAYVADTTVTYETGIANSLGVNGVSKIQAQVANTSTRLLYQTAGTGVIPDNGVLNFSIEAKAAELSQLRMYITTKIPSTNPFVTFNLSTGVVISTTNTTANYPLLSGYGIDSLGNGWYRCWMSVSVVTGAQTPGFYVGIPSLAATVGQGIYVTRAQAGLGSYPTKYTAVLAGTANTLPAASTTGTIQYSVTTKSITQTGGVATATFAAQKHLSFAVGSSITISGATPSGFNGTFVITGSTPTTVTWASSVTGPATVQGTIVRAIGVGSWTTSATNQANQDLTTGQGLVSSKNNLNNKFLAENLVHKVIGKTSPPATVTNFVITPNYSLGLLNLNWTANSEIDVQYYEVRTDTNWGLETNRIFYGAGVTCTAVPAALGVAKTYYIKAIDYSLNYSTTAATVSYTVVVPPTITANPIATFLYNTTSLADTNVIFNWVMPSGSNFLIDRYELTLVKPGVGTLVQEIKDITWTTRANWVGAATLTIKSIDILGNKSVASSTLTVTKDLPASVVSASITKTPVGTGLAISWAEVAPLSTGMAVAGYEIRTADNNWGTALGTMLYSGSATNTTIDINGTTSATTLTYYIKTYDADGRYSSAATSFSYLVAAPVDTSWGVVPFVFGENSLTAATITLTWNPADPIFGLYGYELSYTTTGGVATTKILNTTSIVLNASTIWDVVGTGTVTFTVKVIDNLNVANKSAGAPIAQTTVTKSPPNPVTNYTSRVIDNNVFLSWTPPVKTTLPVNHILILKGDSYATAVNIGEKTGTFTTVFEQTGGTFTYWAVVVDTDGQISTETSLTALVAAPPDYIFNAAYSSIFANVNTTLTNTTVNSANITVASTEGMYVGMQIILNGTAFGGLSAGYWYVVSILNSTTITISFYSTLTPIFTGASTASGTMTLTDATGAEGINDNSLYDTQGILMPVDTTATFNSHFASGTGRTWTGPSDQSTYFPIFIQPGKLSGYFEEVYNYTKPLASSQITMSYVGTAFGAPAITPSISTAGSVSGAAVTLTNTANSTAVTSSAGSAGLVVGSFITVPAATGQTVRVTAVAGNSVTVTPAIVAANTSATFSYAGTWTNYTGTTALGTAFQYVKAKISVAQATLTTGPGTVSAPGGTNTTVTVTGAGGALFTKIFKVGDVITIPGTAVGVDYTISSVTNDTTLAVTVPVSVTMPVITAGTSYAFKGKDLYKLTSLGVKLDAKQKSESGMVAALSTDTAGTIVNFSSTFIDVASINLASQGTTPVTCVYNFSDTNPTGTYTVSGTTTCTVNITAHGLVASTQRAYVTFTSGIAPSGVYPITFVNANQFTIVLPTAITTSGTVSVYPNSMTVYAFNDAGTRISIPSPGVSWTVRGF